MLQFFPEMSDPNSTFVPAGSGKALFASQHTQLVWACDTVVSRRCICFLVELKIQILISAALFFCYAAFSWQIASLIPNSSPDPSPPSAFNPVDAALTQRLNQVGNVGNTATTALPRRTSPTQRTVAPFSGIMPPPPLPPSTFHPHPVRGGGAFQPFPATLTSMPRRKRKASVATQTDGEAVTFPPPRQTNTKKRSIKDTLPGRAQQIGQQEHTTAAFPTSLFKGSFSSSLPQFNPVPMMVPIRTTNTPFVAPVAAPFAAHTSSNCIASRQRGTSARYRLDSPSDTDTDDDDDAGDEDFPSPRKKQKPRSVFPAGFAFAAPPHQQQQQQLVPVPLVVQSLPRKSNKAVLYGANSTFSSVYRGVSKHKVTRRYEAHFWDASYQHPTVNKRTRNPSTNKKRRRHGRQVYLGSFTEEEEAGRMYDKAVLAYLGTAAPSSTPAIPPINFPLADYSEFLAEIAGKEAGEVVADLRRGNVSTRTGSGKNNDSNFRGVQHRKRTDDYIARLNKYEGVQNFCLGFFSTPEEAAVAYDKAVVKIQGKKALTNFPLSNYSEIAKDPESYDIVQVATLARATREPNAAIGVQTRASRLPKQENGHLQKNATEGHLSLAAGEEEEDDVDNDEEGLRRLSAAAVRLSAADIGEAPLSSGGGDDDGVNDVDNDDDDDDDEWTSKTKKRRHARKRQRPTTYQSNDNHESGDDGSGDLLPPPSAAVAAGAAATEADQVSRLNGPGVNGTQRSAFSPATADHAGCVHGSERKLVATKPVHIEPLSLSFQHHQPASLPAHALPAWLHSGRVLRPAEVAQLNWSTSLQKHALTSAVLVAGNLSKKASAPIQQQLQQMKQQQMQLPSSAAGALRRKEEISAQRNNTNNNTDNNGLIWPPPLFTASPPAITLPGSLPETLFNFHSPTVHHGGKKEVKEEDNMKVEEINKHSPSLLHAPLLSPLALRPERTWTDDGSPFGVLNPSPTEAVRMITSLQANTTSAGGGGGGRGRGGRVLDSAVKQLTRLATAGDSPLESLGGSGGSGDGPGVWMDSVPSTQ